MVNGNDQRKIANIAGQLRVWSSLKEKSEAKIKNLLIELNKIKSKY